MPWEKCFFKLTIIFSSALFHVQAILTARPPEGQFVVNGEHIKIETMPHSVFVLLGHEWPSDVTLCSGSLLSHRWVLTAAHCLEDFTEGTGLVKVRLGMDTFSQEGPVSDVKMAKCHDRFHGQNKYSYDVCLLQTFDEIPFSERVQPAALPFANETVQSLAKVRAAGWGVTAAIDFAPPFLLSATDLDIVDYDECNRQYLGRRKEDRRTYFCAGNMGNGFEMKSLCFGDSGSSAVIKRDNGTWVAMGVTCLVNHCKGAVFFVSVPFHVSWIRSMMTRYS